MNFVTVVATTSVLTFTSLLATWVPVFTPSLNTNLNYFSVKQGILGVHPDLAGRLAQQGGLTDESLKEQRSAGLMADNLGGEKMRQICELNEK